MRHKKEAAIQNDGGCGVCVWRMRVGGSTYAYVDSHELASSPPEVKERKSGGES